MEPELAAARKAGRARHAPVVNETFGINLSLRVMPSLYLGPRTS
jgi:hypothetical protein